MDPQKTYGFSPELAASMEKEQIDLQLTRKILDRYNAGCYDHIKPVEVTDLPEVDGKTIIDITGEFKVTLNTQTVQLNLKRLGLNLDLNQFALTTETNTVFTNKGLREIGVLLYPFLAYGILNGGSASSYFDRKKNEAFNPALYQICQNECEILQQTAPEKAKGLAPAFINPDGSPGPSFIELKMRALLIETLRYQFKTGTKTPALAPLYQMTSIHNDATLKTAYEEYRFSSYLQPLIEATGTDITQATSGVQPMLAAFSHSSLGRPKTIFANAFGKHHQVLPMPGGHGQNFEILKKVYRELLAQGKRYIYLGNVDNLGYTVNPTALALVALQHKQAGFDFAFRTAVDIKGGVLIRDQYHRLNCADIGPAISTEEVLRAESLGKNILFNCATGLFDLEYLVANLDYIIDNLPVRISDQDKDAGLYSQAEQVTWEIISLLDDFLIFGVNKYERFLAAKLVLENLMASGIGLDHPNYPISDDPKNNLKAVAIQLNRGLEEQLSKTFGMKKQGGHWVPLTPEELMASF